MEARLKAKELVDKFYQTTPNEAWINEPLGISKGYKAWQQAKECALIAVDEVIDALPDSTNPYNLKQIDYWQQLKVILNKK
jgi:hypothetical protein